MLSRKVALSTVAHSNQVFLLLNLLSLASPLAPPRLTLTVDASSLTRIGMKTAMARRVSKLHRLLHPLSRVLQLRPRTEYCDKKRRPFPLTKPDQTANESSLQTPSPSASILTPKIQKPQRRTPHQKGNYVAFILLCRTMRWTTATTATTTTTRPTAPPTMGLRSTPERRTMRL